MKKRIASIVCAAMLMLALPTLAWANPSPSVITGNGTSGDVTAYVSGEGSLNGGALVVEPSTTQASNASGNIVANFHVYTTGDVNFTGSITLTFNVGAANAGKTATIYIQHENPAGTEVKTATVAADGTISITVDHLSYFSIALSDAKAATTTASADKSSKSPTTGVDLGVVAGGSAVAFAGAAVVAVALRKKVTE